MAKASSAGIHQLSETEKVDFNSILPNLNGITLNLNHSVEEIVIHYLACRLRDVFTTLEDNFLREKLC